MDSDKHQPKNTQSEGDQKVVGAQHETDQMSLGKDTRTVAGLTLISRVLGLIRDLVTVRVFGDTAIGSAFAAAFAIPNMFRRLFGEGALSAAFIPEYTRMADDDPEKSHAFASLTIGLLAMVTGVLTVVIELALLGAIMMSSDNPDRVYSLKLVMVMLPFMPLICIAAIMGGMLQTHRRFGPWAAAPIVLNLCIIAASVPYFFVENPDPAMWAYPIGIAAVISALLQVMWSMWILRGRVRWTTAVGGARDEARAMLKRMVPVLIGLGTLQLNAFVDTLIAMYPNWIGPTFFGHDYPLDESSNAVLFYAQRLYQFPLGVFGIAVATAAFPALSRVAGDPERFGEMLRRGLRLSLFIGIPASVGLWMIGEPLIRVLYSGFGDGFSEDGIVRASSVLAGYSVAIWAYSLNQLFTRSFYAKGDTRTPMTIALWMVLLNITLNLVLIWELGIAGLAWSTAICAVLQCVLLWVQNQRKSIAGKLLDSSVLRSLFKMVSGAILMGVLLYVVLGRWEMPTSWGDQTLRTLTVCAIGAVFYGVWSIVWGMDELRWISARSTERTGTTSGNDGADRDA
ncbi:MAG: murein biosynthesis integral membrane protein MurJ [Phycisphaerales bacterium]